MPIGTVPNYNFPLRPFSSITPFTYSDAMTHLELLERLRWYVFDLVDELNEILEEFADSIEDDIQDAINFIINTLNEKIDEINQALEDQTAEVEQLIEDLRQYVDDAVESIINNSIEVQDPVVAGLIRDEESETRQALDDTYAFIDEFLINVTRHGVVGDGVTNDTEALNQIIQDAPEHARIWAPPGTVSVLDEVVVDKNVTLDYSQAKIIRNNDDVATIQARGEWVYTTAVNTVGTDQKSTSLVVTDASEFGPGDVVKVYSDDHIPQDRSGERGGLMGEIFQVIDVVDGTTIRLAGKLHDTMATNVRVTKMAKVGPRILIGDADFNSNGTGAPTFEGGPMVAFDYTVDAEFDVHVTRSPHAAIRVNSAFRTRGKARVDWAPEDDGYGLSSGGGSKGGVYDITTYHARHSYTDNTGRRGNLTGEITGYGRPMFDDVVVHHYGGTRTGAGIDTHSAGFGHHFHDCVVSGARYNSDTGAAYTTRSGNHTFSNCVAQSVNTGFRLWAEEENISTGLILNNCVVRDSIVAIEMINPAPTQHWNDTPGWDVVINGGYFESNIGSVAHFQGMRAMLNKPVFVYSGDAAPVPTTRTFKTFVTHAAPGIYKGDYDLYANAVTSGDGPAVVNIFGSNGGNNVDMNIGLFLSSYIRDTWPMAVATPNMNGRVNVDLFNSTGDILPVSDFDTGNGKSARNSSYTATGAVNPGRLIVQQNDAMSVQRIADPVVSIVKLNTSEESLGLAYAGPGAFPGQVMHVLNSPSSNGQIVIRDGAGFGTTLGGDVYLNPGSSFALCYMNDETGWVRAFGSRGDNEISA